MSDKWTPEHRARLQALSAVLDGYEDACVQANEILKWPYNAWTEQECIDARAALVKARGLA